MLVVSLDEQGFRQLLRAEGKKCPGWWGSHGVGMGVFGGGRAGGVGKGLHRWERRGAVVAIPRAEVMGQ